MGNIEKKDLSLEERDFDLEKRQRFISTFTDTPRQFKIFSTTLQHVLGGAPKIIELKKSARETESLILGRKDFCDDVGFFSFQSYLHDAFENWGTVIEYIYSMPVATRTKHIKELKYLWMHCNQDIDLPKAISICYDLQNDITDNFQSPPAPAEELLLVANGWGGNTLGLKHIPPPKIEGARIADTNFYNDFCPEIKEQLWADDREKEEKDAKQLKAFLASINKTYVFTNKGVPYRKSSFLSGTDQLKRNPGNESRD